MTDVLPAPLSADRPLHIVVLGAGMSGLVAALELERAGHAVTVLEARERPGGRVFTMRDASREVAGEAGAGRIPETHRWTMNYIERMGLQTDPLYPVGLNPVIYAQGKRVTVGLKEDPAQHFDLPSSEKALGLKGLHDAYLMSGVERVRTSGTMNGPAWPPKALADLDRVTTADYLAESGLSQSVTQLLTLGSFPRSISALMLFRVLATYDSSRLRKIRGGNDLLPTALARTLKAPIQYRCVVRAIHQHADYVDISVEMHGGLQCIQSDRVVCTIPFSVLSKVDIQPTLSREKQAIIAGMRYTDACKTMFRTRRRPWEQEGFSGFAQLDSMAEIWSVRHGKSVQGGLIQLYQQGARAVEMDSMSKSERLETAAKTIERVFPGALRDVEETFEHSWQQDPWAGGAYGMASPGQLYAWKDHIARPEGRIYFAGEHTSLEYAAWIEGAVRSGYRAAAEANACFER